eukprot:233929-Pyramimonas_sp.AAC.1
MVDSGGRGGRVPRGRGGRGRSPPEVYRHYSKSGTVHLYLKMLCPVSSRLKTYILHLTSYKNITIAVSGSSIVVTKGGVACRSLLDSKVCLLI